MPDILPSNQTIIPNNETLETEIRRLLSNMSPQQVTYAVALIYTKDHKDALLSCGISEETYKSWPENIQQDCEEIANIVVFDTLVLSRRLLREAVLQAVLVKMAGLSSPDEEIRQKAATDIIEWELGKAGTKNAQTKGDALLKLYEAISPDDWNNR